MDSDVPLELAAALLRNGTFSELHAMLRLEALKAIEPTIKPHAYSNGAGRAAAKLVGDWLSSRGLQNTRAALEIEATPLTWPSSSTQINLQDVVPYQESVPTFTPTVPLAQDMSSQGRIVIQALSSSKVTVEIHARLSNLILEEFKRPGSRTKPASLDSQHQIVIGMVVEQWLLAHRLHHTRDVLRAETGLMLDGSSLNFSLEGALIQ